ncbi:MAG TPA: hypothetical protein VM943_12250 [Pyrinomonadaceae bacterium]|nr:hypothetical protein [Pyrinomonadaceae bacterium]
MSEKKRQKEDGQNKDKKNKAARESRNEREQRATSPQQAKAVSNLSDTEPGASETNEEANGRVQS